jgi:HEAT repeat protein
MPQGHPVSRLNLARRVVVQTDRTLAIAQIIQFLSTQTHPFPRWQAAYTLGKSLAPGHPVAVATLRDLLHTAPDAYRRWQFSDSLSRVQPGHPDAIATLTHLLQPEHPPKIRCKAAYSLGKFQPRHPDARVADAIVADAIVADAIVADAIATLETLRDTVQNPGLLAQIRDNLHRLHHGPAQPTAPPSRPTRTPSDKAIAGILTRLHAAPNPTEQRRHAARLARLQPNHPEAIATLLRLLLTPGHPAALYKRLAKDIKAVIQTEHSAQIVGPLKAAIAHIPPSVQRHECDRILWYCTDAMAYHEFIALNRENS